MPKPCRWCYNSWDRSLNFIIAESNWAWITVSMAWFGSLARLVEIWKQLVFAQLIERWQLYNHSGMIESTAACDMREITRGPLLGNGKLRTASDGCQPEWTMTLPSAVGITHRRDPKSAQIVFSLLITLFIKPQKELRITEQISPSRSRRLLAFAGTVEVYYASSGSVPQYWIYYILLLCIPWGPV